MIREDFTYGHNSKDIHYSIWFTDNNRSIDTIIYLGTVQVEKLPEWVARVCPPRTAIAQGAPHWHAKVDGSDIPQFMFGYTKSVFQNIVTNHKFNRVNVIADSQAVPGVVRLFTLNKYNSYLKNAVFLQPLGFTANIFQGTDEERIEKFRKRIIKNAYHQLTALLLDSRLRYNHRLLTNKVSFRDPKAKAQYNSGLKHDSLQDLERLLSLNKNITIICGAKDQIFPADEIKTSLKQEGIKVPIVSVKRIPHSPLATKQGLKLRKAKEKAALTGDISAKSCNLVRNPHITLNY